MVSTTRILVVIEARSVSGAVKPILEFAREASRSQLEISFLTFARNEKENAFIRAVRAEGLEIDLVPERFPFDPQVIPALRAVLRKRRPHFLWTNSVKSHFLTRLSGLHRQTRWVAFHHGYTSTSWKTLCYNQLDRWSHRGAAQVVTVCDNFAELLARQGVERGRIHVQHTPIRRTEPVSEAAAAALRRDLGIAANAPVVLSVGRLSKEKGHAELLRALPEVKAKFLSVRLVLVGDGPERKPLEALARELGLDGTVLFLGQQDAVRPFYSIADVFALPSHSEGSPNVLLEAMDAGVPVVAAAVGGVPEIAVDGVHALLVRKQDIAGFASALTRVLADDGLRHRLSGAAYQVLEKHTPEQYFLGIASVFEKLAGDCLRLLLKRAVQAVSLLIAFPFALLCGFGRIRPLFNIFGHIYALGPAMLGNLLRAGYYRLTLRDCSMDTNISFGVLFPHPDVSIGHYVSIGSYSIIGRARIGARTQIGAHVQVPSGRHQHPRDAEGNLVGSVDGLTVIGADCWIGTSAVIMAEVGDGSTIGAGSVVVKDIPARVVAVGNPAKVIRSL